jgi:hypothetical protein
MARQRMNSARALVAGLDAARLARAMAAVRLGIGFIGVLAPGRLAWRLFVQGRRLDEGIALALRAAAARDLALGVGTAFASGRGPEPLRGWLLASAVADCCDAVIMARSKSASAAARTATALVSGLSAGAQIVLARRLRADRASHRLRYIGRRLGPSRFPPTSESLRP